MTDAMIPDDSDWTCVLERPCPECGFDAATFDPRLAGDALRSNAASWADLLEGDPGALMQRRREDRWSDLEYAAHVRDVCRIYLDRLTMMLSEDDPLYSNWDQDETAVQDAYNSQDPVVVSADLLAAAGSLGAAFDAVSGDQWNRPGRRSDGASFTVASFARYLVHDPLHHLWDVAGSSARVR